MNLPRVLLAYLRNTFWLFIVPRFAMYGRVPYGCMNGLYLRTIFSYTGN